MNTFVDSSDALCGSLELRRPCLVWSVRGGSHCLEFYSQPSAPKVLYHSANIFELCPPPDRLTRSPIHKAKGESYRITALSALCLPSSWDSISLHQCYQESSMSHGSVNSSHKFQEQVQALSSKHQSRVGRQGSKVWSLSPPTLSNARSSKENFTEWFL